MPMKGDIFELHIGQFGCIQIFNSWNSWGRVNFPEAHGILEAETHVLGHGWVGIHRLQRHWKARDSLGGQWFVFYLEKRINSRTTEEQLLLNCRKIRPQIGRWPDIPTYILEWSCRWTGLAVFNVMPFFGMPAANVQAAGMVATLLECRTT